MDALKGCMVKNKRLGRYDIKYNNFGDDGNFLTFNLSYSYPITYLATG